MKVELLDLDTLKIEATSYYKTPITLAFNELEVGESEDIVAIHPQDNVNLLATLSAFNGADWMVYDAIMGETGNLTKNLSPEWTLTGSDTAFLRRQGGEYPENVVDKIVYAKEFIPVNVGDTIHFRGLFASHRCNVSLKLEFYDEDKRTIDDLSRSVPPTFQGGREAQNYAEMTVSVPVPAGAKYIRPVIVKFTPAENNRMSESYAFFSDLYLYTGPKAFSKARFEPVVMVDNIKDKTGAIYRHTFTINLNATPLSLETVISMARKNVKFYEHKFRKVAVNKLQFTYTNRDNYISVSFPNFTDMKEGDISLFIDKKRVQDASANLGSELGSIVAPVGKTYLDNSYHYVTVTVWNVPVYATVDYFYAQKTSFDALQQHAPIGIPAPLSPIAAYRYRNMEKHLADGAKLGAVELDSLSRAHALLAAGPDTKTFKAGGVAFPKHANPDFSVIVPVHNKSQYTRYCLMALYFAFNKASYEVIVVDDGSTDDTADMLKDFSNIKVVTHKTAQGFIGACNDGAKVASGKYITLLNNDTEPMCEWLDETLHIFDAYDNVGAVGSKLIYQDGRLQEAGGIIWNNAQPWNYGRGDNALHPRFNYTRQADYLTGAALTLRADLWRKVGGLSEEYMPAYFEDTDMSFKVRAAGYKTVYAPLSVVCHFEGVSNGKDVAGSGLKRFQAINAPKFKKKWIHAVSNNGDVGVRPDLEKDRNVRGRVLFMDEQLPRPDYDAGSYIVIQELRILQSLGFKVTFAAEGLHYLGKYIHDLQRMGIEVLHSPFYNAIAEVLHGFLKDVDFVYIVRYTMAHKYIEMIRAIRPDIKIVLNCCDVHFLRELRRALLTKDQELLNRAQLVRKNELTVMRAVDLNLSYTETELAVLESHDLAADKLAKAPWVLDIVDSVKPFKERAHIAFLGGYHHTPNIDAVNWFCKEVMPALRLKRPGIEFHIYGSSMPDSFEELEGPDVVLKGYIENVADLYENYRLFVSPLQFGAGIKGKVLTALSYGLPSVLSKVSAEGTGAGHLNGCLIAEKASEWVDSIAKLYDDQKQWETLSQQALAVARIQYSFEVGQKMMAEALEKIGVYAAPNAEYLYRKTAL